MWWCCGKSSLDAPGCKFGKHLSTKDEEDQEERNALDPKHSKLIRC